MADEIKYGLTPAGFKRKRLPEIIKSINSRLSDSLGVRIQTSSNSVFGQLVGVFSYEISDLWEQCENTYNSMYPSTAKGSSLSNAAGLAGIQPIEAEFTTIVATCFGANGAEIPYAAQITDDARTYTYSCTDVYEQILSSRASIIGIKISAGSVVAGTSYELTIDEQTQTYTATETDTVNSVLVSLAAMFLFDDRSFSVNDGALLITMADQSKTMSVIPGETLYLSVVGSPFNFQCDTAGAITPALGTVTQIVTTYAGWDRVENNVEAATGRDAETDIALRQRWAASVYSRASAMTEAIRAALLDVDGVEYAIVYENDTDETDENGRPPHSIEAIVEGGSSVDIARTIWRTHAGGITTFGDSSQVILDSQGIRHVMRFNRPTAIPIYMRITVTENPERELSGAAPSLIQSAIVSKGNTLEAGQNVVLQAFYGIVMEAASYAIGYMDIKASTDGENYNRNNIDISPRERAAFFVENIEIIIDTN